MFQSLIFTVRRLPYRNGNQIFSYFFDRMTYPEALSRCRPNQPDNGPTSRLLIINSQEIQDTVISHLRDDIGLLPPDVWDVPIDPGYWVAGSDILAEGTFRWIDGSVIPTQPGQLGYQNWYREGGFFEPSATVDAEDCLYISAIRDGGTTFPNILGRWLDSVCFARKYFICQEDAPASECKAFLIDIFMFAVLFKLFLFYLSYD